MNGEHDTVTADEAERWALRDGDFIFGDDEPEDDDDDDDDEPESDREPTMLGQLRDEGGRFATFDGTVAGPPDPIAAIAGRGLATIFALAQSIVDAVPDEDGPLTRFDPERAFPVDAVALELALREQAAIGMMLGAGRAKAEGELEDRLDLTLDPAPASLVLLAEAPPMDTAQRVIAAFPASDWTGGIDFVRWPWAKIVEQFAARSVVRRPTWDRMFRAARKRAFTVATLAKKSQLELAKGVLVQAMADGVSVSAFKKRLAEAMTAEGWTPLRPWHAEVVFRTNALTAIVDGRKAQMREVLAARPFWAWDATKDGRTRAAHAAAHGLAMRGDDPAWDRLGPPAGYNCRCGLRSLTEAQVTRRALRVVTGDDPAWANLPDAGFNPGDPTGGSPEGTPIEQPKRIAASERWQAIMLGFDPNQPRNPQGSATGGRWTKAGADMTFDEREAVYQQMRAEGAARRAEAARPRGPQGADAAKMRTDAVDSLSMGALDDLLPGKTAEEREALRPTFETAAELAVQRAAAGTMDRPESTLDALAESVDGDAEVRKGLAEAYDFAAEVEVERTKEAAVQAAAKAHPTKRFVDVTDATGKTTKVKLPFAMRSEGVQESARAAAERDVAAGWVDLSDTPIDGAVAHFGDDDMVRTDDGMGAVSGQYLYLDAYKARATELQLTEPMREQIRKAAEQGLRSVTLDTPHGPRTSYVRGENTKALARQGLAAARADVTRALGLPDMLAGTTSTGVRSMDAALRALAKLERGPATTADASALSHDYFRRPATAAEAAAFARAYKAEVKKSAKFLADGAAENERRAAPAVEVGEADRAKVGGAIVGLAGQHRRGAHFAEVTATQHHKRGAPKNYVPMNRAELAKVERDIEATVGDWPTKAPGIGAALRLAPPRLNIGSTESKYAAFYQRSAGDGIGMIAIRPASNVAKSVADRRDQYGALFDKPLNLDLPGVGSSVIPRDADPATATRLKAQATFVHESGHLVDDVIHSVSGETTKLGGGLVAMMSRGLTAPTFTVEPADRSEAEGALHDLREAWHGFHPSRYSTKNRDEKFAETWTAYHVRPDALRAQAPAVFDAVARIERVLVSVAKKNGLDQ